MSKGDPDLGRKARWVDAAISPMDATIRSGTRTLSDLPKDVTPGARQVAIVTGFRSVQEHLLDPVMQALKELEALPKQAWTRGLLVAGPAWNFDWRHAPLRKYESFADFYNKELARVWGEWSKLQKTYSEYERGNLTAKQAARDIQRNAIALAGPEAEGGVRAGMTHAEAGKMGGRGKKASAGGTGLTRGSNQARTIVARLKKDRPDVAERLAAGEFRSARAAAIEAGIVSAATRIPLTDPKAVTRKLIARGDAFASEVMEGLRAYFSAKDRR